MRPGTDPAELLTLHGTQALQDLLDQPNPLSQTMLRNLLTEHDDDHQVARRAIDIITAADASVKWVLPQVGVAVSMIAYGVARSKCPRTRSRTALISSAFGSV